MRTRIRKTLVLAAAVAAVCLPELAFAGMTAGGSGLQLETQMQPWVRFLTGTVPQWAGAAAVIAGGSALAFGGMIQGGGKLVQSLGGASVVVGAVPWVLPMFGVGSGALLP